MAVCGSCGRPVEWREVDGARVAFDLYEVGRGEGRYVEQQGGRLTPVSPDADVLAAQRHDVTCGVGHRT